MIELNAVLAAAEELLDARSAGEDCRGAWRALQGAIALAREARPERQERFVVEADHLVRRVVGSNGNGYEVRCHRGDFAAVARAVAGRDLFVRGDLARAACVSRAPALVAMMFLKSQGLVTNRGRQFHAATSRFSVEAALAAYAALDAAPAVRLVA
jgi:hypothetical protein